MKTHTQFSLMKVLSVCVCAIVFWPLITLFTKAIGFFALFPFSRADFENFWQFILPIAAYNTLVILCVAVSIGVFFGTVSAVFLHLCDVKYRKIFAFICVVPLIIPSYLSSLGLIMVLDANAHFFGISNIRDFFTSAYGAGLIFGLSLSPYVFLTCTAYLGHVDLSCLSAASTMGIGPRKITFDILMPIIRPAYIGGGALIAMETLNDIGTASFLGVNTLTTAALSQWVNKSNLNLTAFVSMIVLCVAFGLLAVERNARKSLVTVQDAHIRPRSRTIHLPLYLQIFCITCCVLPFFCIFLLPLIQFIKGALLNTNSSHFTLWAMMNSVVVAIIVAFLCCCIGLIILNTRVTTRSRFMRTLLRTATIGYAIPSTLIALGLLLGLPSISGAWDAIFPKYEGIVIRSFLVYSPVLMIIALTIRFLSVAHSPLEATTKSISPIYEAAARTLGASKIRAYLTIRLPLFLPTILSAALMVAVDTIKELPATLLLRPFNFETLPTLIFAAAHREAYEEAAPAALLLIVCCVPILSIVLRFLDKRING